ncbi:MAG: hypothetical protein JJD98_17430 [Polaromonas sp.]|nr:hypothetical protein [Polaromonas sp.]
MAVKISVKYVFGKHRVILGFPALLCSGAWQARNSPVRKTSGVPTLINAASAETEIRQDEANDDNEAYDINDGVHDPSLGYLDAPMWAPSDT